MAVSIEERMAHVEGRVKGQAQMMADIGARLVGLDQKFDLKFAALEAKFDRKFAELEARMSSNFRWMVGIQITTLVALLASFIAG